ncbi:hypothetical protein F5Y19DRAFT_489984 [Xylariaceae sp. FL1651]|nr:hypothetical protein F5Y19DRAFT_489984 [Xylariaceae sp. FL1651]
MKDAMAEPQEFIRPFSTWTSFITTTLTTTIQGTALPTYSSASSSLLTTSSTLTSFLSTTVESTSTPSTSPSTSYNTSSTASPLTSKTGSVPPSTPVSNSTFALDTSTSVPVDGLPPSTDGMPTPSSASLTAINVSPQIPWTTPSTSGHPSVNATNDFPPPLNEGGDVTQVPIIIAVVITLVTFFVLSGIFVRLFVIRRRQRLARKRQSLRIDNDAVVQNLPPSELAATTASGVLAGSQTGYSIANTYHSMHRGEVRIVIERPPVDRQVWTRRLWPIPPGHSGYYTYSTRSGTTEGDSITDPNQWSMASQDGSSNVPETRTSGSTSVWGAPRIGWAS